MEGSQGLCVETHPRVHDLLAEQVRADTPHRVATTSTHSRAEMGEHFYGFHYRPSSSAGKGPYICGGRQDDQICTFLCHTHGLQGHIGRKFVF
jgi:hypothetical protein